MSALEAAALAATWLASGWLFLRRHPAPRRRVSALRRRQLEELARTHGVTPWL